MLWQYAIGLLHLTNAQLQNIGFKVDYNLLKELVDTRCDHLHQQFNIMPSFKVMFLDNGNGGVNMQKEVTA